MTKEVLLQRKTLKCTKICACVLSKIPILIPEYIVEKSTRTHTCTQII